MEQDTITMAILIAKVYKKKERVFYAQQNIHHQEQKQEDGHLLKVMSAWFPQKSQHGDFSCAILPGKGNIVGELPKIIFPTPSLKYQKMVIKQKHWKLDCLSRGGTAPLTSLVLCRDLHNYFFCSTAAFLTSPPCSFQLGLPGPD